MVKTLKRAVHYEFKNKKMQICRKIGKKTEHFSALTSFCKTASGKSLLKMTHIKTRKNFINICIPSPQLCMNNTGAIFVFVYFCPQRLCKMCVSKGPFNVLKTKNADVPSPVYYLVTWVLFPLWKYPIMPSFHPRSVPDSRN